MARVAGIAKLTPNDGPLVAVNQAALRCLECNEVATLTWREGEYPSPDGEADMGLWRQVHHAHDGYEEALPVLGKYLPEFTVPPVGHTEFLRTPYNAPQLPPHSAPSPPLTAPPAPDVDQGGGESPSSHYPGL